MPPDHPANWDDRYRLKYKTLDCILRNKNGETSDNDEELRTVIIDTKEFIAQRFLSDELDEFGNKKLFAVHGKQLPPQIMQDEIKARVFPDIMTRE